MNARTSKVVIFILIAVICVMLSLTSTSTAKGQAIVGQVSGGSIQNGPGTASTNHPPPHLIATCLSDYLPLSAAYDPADGLIYVALGVSPPEISILKSPCTLLEAITISTGEMVAGVAYDPLTKEVVAIDSIGEAYVLQGFSIVKRVSLIDSTSYSFCPSFPTWDAALGAMLITDPCRGGIDILQLTIAGGATHEKVRISAFDSNNVPTGVLVAAGYIFCPGSLGTDVFNDRTLRYMGSFPVAGQTAYTPLTWDPVNQTVAVGLATGISSEEVYFLEVGGIASHKFAFHNLRVHGILDGGVGGIGYSPANQNIYVTAAGGDDVWILGPTGLLSHVYLQPPLGMSNVAYDSGNQDEYVCGFSLYVVS